MTRGALAVAIAAALAFVIGAALHRGPAFLGGTAALACFAFAVAAGALAVSLRAPADLAEPRHPHGPTALEPLPADVVSRSSAFGWMWAATVGAFALVGLVPLLALDRWNDRRPSGWGRGIRLVDPNGRPVHAADLAIGGVETVFPQGKVDLPESAAMLIRLDQQTTVAYSKICTHAGCPVAIYRQASRQLYCPCHQSVFDVLADGRPISGPAPRPLPKLPLGTDSGGYLIAQGDFDAPVGPDTWWRTV
jgi:ubiquinol-cytochrome c reductase iron-sulfur subunit